MHGENIMENPMNKWDDLGGKLTIFGNIYIASEPLRNFFLRGGREEGVGCWKRHIYLYINLTTIRTECQSHSIHVWYIYLHLV